MKAIMVMFDSLNLRMLSAYGCPDAHTPNFDRLARHSVQFEHCYIGSMPCMPARREIHTGRYNFLHHSWGPLEPFDDSMPEMLKQSGVYTHLVSDHQHYWEDGGATYHSRYNSWEISRGQEGDLWKGQVRDPDLSDILETEPPAKKAALKRMHIQDLTRQDAVNRAFLKEESDMPQAVTFKNGLEFIQRNYREDNWFLQIETFDPHEPFFASKRFQELFPDPDYTGKEFDWPPYARVTQTEAEKEHCIKRYKALVSMCDHYLGTVLDAMDRYGLWEDTMLIVNTDHGFLLGEHGWWAKSNMPYYEELSHIPLFIWDPRSGKQGEKREALVQTIDLAPTVLEYFGIKRTPDMQGHPLKDTIREDHPVRQYALFGCHGAHINITDERYVYMRCPSSESQMYEYTLMPTHMRSRYSPAELQKAEFAPPFSFTKGCPLLKIPAGKNPLADPMRYGNKLFDLKSDPKQVSPLADPKTEARLLNAMQQLVRENDAPEEVYENYRLKKQGDFTEEDLICEHCAEEKREIPGLESLSLSRSVFIQINTLFNLLPQSAAEIKTLLLKNPPDKTADSLSPQLIDQLLSSVPEGMRFLIRGAVEDAAISE